MPGNREPFKLALVIYTFEDLTRRDKSVIDLLNDMQSFPFGKFKLFKAVDARQIQDSDPKPMKTSWTKLGLAIKAGEVSNIHLQDTPDSANAKTLLRMVIDRVRLVKDNPNYLWLQVSSELFAPNVDQVTSDLLEFGKEAFNSLGAIYGYAGISAIVGSDNLTMQPNFPLPMADIFNAGIERHFKQGIKGVYWANFLSKHHLKLLGDSKAVAQKAGCYRLDPLQDGQLLLLTRYPLPGENNDAEVYKKSNQLLASLIIKNTSVHQISTQPESGQSKASFSEVSTQSKRAKRTDSTARMARSTWTLLPVLEEVVSSRSGSSKDQILRAMADALDLDLPETLTHVLTRDVPEVLEGLVYRLDGPPTKAPHVVWALNMMRQGAQEPLDNLIPIMPVDNRSFACVVCKKRGTAPERDYGRVVRWHLDDVPGRAQYALLDLDAKLYLDSARAELEARDRGLEKIKQIADDYEESHIKQRRQPKAHEIRPIRLAVQNVILGLAVFHLDSTFDGLSVKAWQTCQAPHVNAHEGCRGLASMTLAEAFRSGSTYGDSI